MVMWVILKDSEWAAYLVIEMVSLMDSEWAAYLVMKMVPLKDLMKDSE